MGWSAQGGISMGVALLSLLYKLYWDKSGFNARTLHGIVDGSFIFWVTYTLSYVFKWFASWWNNKHYQVMYSVLCYHYWQCETRERNQTGCVLFKPHHRYACDAIFYIYFSCFPLQKFVGRYVLLYFSVQTNFVRDYLVVFFVIWQTVLVAPMSALIDRSARLSFTFDSQLSLCLQITLLYSSLVLFLAIKLLSKYYLLCDQVTYRMFQFSIPDGIVR